MAIERRGVLFVVSAPSGAGKTTLCKELVTTVTGVHPSISYTTRTPRPRARRVPEKAPSPRLRAKTQRRGDLGGYDRREFRGSQFGFRLEVVHSATVRA